MFAVTGDYLSLDLHSEGQFFALCCLILTLFSFQVVDVHVFIHKKHHRRKANIQNRYGTGSVTLRRGGDLHQGMFVAPVNRQMGGLSQSDAFLRTEPHIEPQSFSARF